MPNIRQELIIAAPARRIYRALTTRQGLAGWWTPDVSGDPNPGGVVRFTFGGGYFKEMKVVEQAPDSRVCWDCLTGAEEWVGTRISFDLLAGGERELRDLRPEAGDQLDQQQGLADGVLLEHSHDHWRDYTPMFAECSFTWGRFLTSLKRFCETGTGAPWPSQHRAN